MKRVVLLVALLCAGGLAGCTPRPNDAEPAAAAFLEAVETQDYDTLASLVDDPAGATSSIRATWDGLQAVPGSADGRGGAGGVVDKRGERVVILRLDGLQERGRGGFGVIRARSAAGETAGAQESHEEDDAFHAQKIAAPVVAPTLPLYWLVESSV